MVPHLFRIAETAEEPLCFYATGLLAAAMEVSDIASAYKDKNAVLVRKLLIISILNFANLTGIDQVPIMLKRLKTLKEQSEKVELPQIHRPKLIENGPFADVKSESFESSSERPKLDAVLAAENQSKISSDNAESSSQQPKPSQKHFGPSLVNPIRVGFNSPSSTVKTPQSGSKRKSPPTVSPNAKKPKLTENSANKDWSSSSWAELEPYLIGPHYCLHPLSKEMKQRLILWYLVPVGEYQEVRMNDTNLKISLQFLIDLTFSYSVTR